MKKAVMYGAGNIGRGFIGKVFANSGYKVVFLDIAKDILDALNQKKGYTVKIVCNEYTKQEQVQNVCGADANSTEAIEEIATCDIMATAVGVNVLKYVAPVIAKGISLRKAMGGAPLDIILAENQLDADKIMKEHIYSYLNDDEEKWADKNIGLVESSIGRMVPPLTAEEKQGDPLLIAVEPYCDLPVDSKAFKGEIPNLVGLIPYTPFGFYIKRKLFIHNMGHALCAYFGYLKGYEYIWQAVEDKEIYEQAKQAMLLSAQALNKEYGVPIEEIEANVYDLLSRFANKALKDTVARVGADPIRKLRRDDRLIGGAMYCMQNGLDPSYIIKGICASLKFNNQADEKAVLLQQDLQQKGLQYVVEHYMGLKPGNKLGDLIIMQKNKA